MLRIVQNSSASRAKSYYSTADYYAQSQELAGVWRGRGAALLGLSGSIDRAAWDAICDNRDPRSGEPLTLRTKEPRTIGYDFNIHAPKGVSLLYGLTRDERLLGAFQESVDATMRDMEDEAATRVRKADANVDRPTGNLLWGEFVHLTARPVDGVPDPHLHSHCFVFNATWDREEGAWKAAQFRELKRDAPYFESLFHARFARKLADLGLPIVRTPKSWDVGELSSDLLRRFSRRTAQIEARAAELGIDDVEARAELGAKTRSPKAKELSLGELQQEWRGRMTKDEQESLEGLAERIGTAGAAPNDGAARQAIEYALAHEFQRSSVVPERRVLATALRRGTGEARPEEVLKAFEQARVIRGERDGRRLITTQDVLREEREIVDFARAGRGTSAPLAAELKPDGDSSLNGSQRAAIEHILRSRDRVLTVQGAAGVGKTTLMQAAAAAIEAAGTKVLPFAPTANASRGVLRGDGFEQAETVARLLVDPNLQEAARGQLIWIDEAGLLGTRTLRDVFRLAERVDARVLLTGDRRQHGAVDRGSVLRLLEQEAGVRPARVTEIRRQRGEYKEAVRALSEGRLESALQTLDRLGWIEEIPDDERYRRLAADYVSAVKAGETALVVAPTHAEGGLATYEIRRRLREERLLRGEEREFATLHNLRLTEAEKTDPTNYQAGDVVQYFQHARGHRSGTRSVVADSPPVEHAARYAVFRPSTLRLAAGDVIRITHNGKTRDGKHRLDNGAIHQVKGFDADGHIRLVNGWTIDKAFGHVAHGYVVTSHASQGRTVDRVFVGQGSQSSPASSREQFYVSCSRGRKSVTVYCDDKAALREAVEQSEERVTATEFLAPLLRERDRRRQLTQEPPAEATRNVDRELAYGR